MTCSTPPTSRGPSRCATPSPRSPPAYLGGLKPKISRNVSIAFVLLLRYILDYDQEVAEAHWRPAWQGAPLGRVERSKYAPSPREERAGRGLGRVAIQ